jgi:hypothetical protein
MVKFRNCVFIVVFFAMISFLAFFPADSKKDPAGKTISTDSVSTPSPIPQKAEGGPAHKTPAAPHHTYL